MMRAKREPTLIGKIPIVGSNNSLLLLRPHENRRVGSQGETQLGGMYHPPLRSNLPQPGSYGARDVLIEHHDDGVRQAGRPVARRLRRWRILTLQSHLHASA